MTEFSKRIKKLRKETGLSQEKMAEKLCVKRANYMKKENGKLEFKRSEMIIFMNIVNETYTKSYEKTLTLDEIFK